MKSKIAAREASAVTHDQSLLSKVKRHVSHQNYVAALQLLRDPGYDAELQNAHGVCLLRLGRYAEAVQWYRAILLRSGSIAMRPELPTYLKANFATALLLAGQTEGCISTLTETQDDHHPVVIRLHRCLKQWAKQLTMRQWLAWKFGVLDPAQIKVTLDFAPGVFEDDEICKLSSADTNLRNSTVQPGAQRGGL